MQTEAPFIRNADEWQGIVDIVDDAEVENDDDSEREEKQHPLTESEEKEDNRWVSHTESTVDAADADWKNEKWKKRKKLKEKGATRQDEQKEPTMQSEERDAALICEDTEEAWSEIDSCEFVETSRVTESDEDVEDVDSPRAESAT